MSFEITEEAVQILDRIAAEVPGKFAIPIADVIRSLKKIEENRNPKMEAEYKEQDAE